MEQQKKKRRANDDHSMVEMETWDASRLTARMPEATAKTARGSNTRCAAEEKIGLTFGL